MKKYIVLLLLTITLLPILVQAEDKSIVLKSISLNEKSDNVVEVSPATIKDNKLLVDFKMYEVGDYIEYKIKVQNNSRETLEVDESRLLPSVNYIKYSVDSNSKSIKAGEEKDILLKITYQNKVANGDYFSAKYINQDKIPLVFKSPTIINPETIRNILPIILVISVMVGYSVYNKKKINLSKAMILLLLIGIIPNLVSALEEEIIIEPNIMIRKVKPTACTYDGELVQGAEYTNGQYTYRYMQEKTSTSWQNIDNDGWGVTLTDKEATEDVTSTLCSTINDKPLVSTSYMFSNSKTSSIDTSSFDTQEVTNMSSMFNFNANLTTLDVSYFDTSKVTSMSSFLNACSKLSSIDPSTFDTSKVIDMSFMFQISGIKELNLSKWDTSNVTDMSQMFFACEKLTSVNLDNWDTSNVTNMREMFYYCISLPSLNLNDFNTSNVANTYQMFYNCYNLSSLDLSNFSAFNVTNVDNMFYNCDNLKSLKLDNLDLSNSATGTLNGILNGTNSLKELSCKNWKIPVTFTDLFFIEMGGLNSAIEKIDVTGWDLSNTTNISGLFRGDYSDTHPVLKEIIGLDTWDTSSITNMSQLFYNCSSLVSIDLSALNTSKITNMNAMFINCSSLESLKLDNWDLSNSTNGSSILSGAFSGTTSLKEISCKNWKLPTTFTHVFYRTLAGSSSPIEKIDVTGWDLSKTTSIMGLFGDGDTLKQIIGLNTWDTSNITDMNGMFYGCNIITTLDLSSFDTSNVTNMDLMFKNCNNITTAYGRTQADCNKFNSSSDKPSNVNFIVKPS